MISLLCYSSTLLRTIRAVWKLRMLSHRRSHGRLSGHAPQDIISSRSCHFVFREAVSQSKYCYSLKVERFPPPKILGWLRHCVQRVSTPLTNEATVYQRFYEIASSVVISSDTINKSRCCCERSGVDWNDQLVQINITGDTTASGTLDSLDSGEDSMETDDNFSSDCLPPTPRFDMHLFPELIADNPQDGSVSCFMLYSHTKVSSAVLLIIVYLSNASLSRPATTASPTMN